jgi:hypothetical protein
MPLLTTATLAAMHAALEGVDVVIGATALIKAGIFRNPEIEVLDSDGGRQVGGRTVVYVPTALLPEFEIGDPITVDGTAYTVRETFRIENGQETEIVLAQV